MGCRRQAAWLAALACLSFGGIAYAVPPKPTLWAHSESARQLYAQNPADPIRDGARIQADGIEHVLVIRVDFSDQRGVRPRQEIDRWLFDPDVPSLASYYDEVSYGQMQVEPGVGNGSYPLTNAWYRIPDRMAIYGAGRINVPLYQELVRDACNAADQDVNFADYDRDGDGVVDHLIILHSGGDEAASGVPEEIWSILVPDVVGRWDGKRIAAAMVIAEEPDADVPHLGVWFHEFFHDFGAPETYVTGTLVGEHDHQFGLMGLFGPYQGGGAARDGTQPSHICGYLKWDFDGTPENGRHGWITPIEIDVNTVGMAVPAFALPGDVPPLYKIDIPGRGGTEFFLIENRSTVEGALFDTALPDNGLLIWHVDESAERSTLSVAPRMWLEDPSDPKHFDLSLTITQDAAYSKEDRQTEFSPSTDPSSHANDGTRSEISMLNISHSGPSMTLDLFIGDTYEPNDSIPEAYALTFDAARSSFLFDADDVVDYYGVAAANGDRLRVNVVFDGAHMVDVTLVDAHDTPLAQASTFWDAAAGQTRHELLYFADRQESLYVRIAPQTPVQTSLKYTITATRDPDLASAPPRITGLQIYPNPVPAGDILRIGVSFQRAGVDRLQAEVFTVDGTRVGSAEQTGLATGATTFDFATRAGSRPLAPGVYFVLVTAEVAGQATRRLAKFAVQ